MPATAQVRISADTAQFHQSMGKVQKSINNLGRLAEKQAGIISRVFKSITKLTALGGVVGTPTAFVASERMYRKFEHNMMEVFTLLPKANEAMFEKMKKDALDFSESYGVLPEEVAKGMYQSISAGISTDELDDFMGIAQRSAVAGVTDLRTAVDALTNVVNAYGKGQYDIEEVADNMFHAVSMSKTTFRELADYMYQIIPTAASMKVRMDDLLGSISALAATGTLTRVGTTQLRQFLIELSRTGDKANEAFLLGSGGVAVQNFIKDGGRMVEIVKILGDVAKSKRTDLRNLFSSVEAGNAALTLFNSTAYEGMVESIENSSKGAMSKAFEKMESTLQYRFNRIMRAGMNVFIRLGEVIKPMLDDLYEYFEGVAEKIKSIKWDELEASFNVVWHKIKKSISDGKAWTIFKKYANVAFKELQYLIYDVIGPAIDSLTNKFTQLFNEDYKIGESIMGMLGGLKDYLFSFAKDFGLALLDALKAPMAFIRAGLESAVQNMMDSLADTLPDSMRSIIGIKTKEEREIDRSNEVLAKRVKLDKDVRDKVNKEIYGDEYLAKREEQYGLMKDLDDLEAMETDSKSQANQQYKSEAQQLAKELLGKLDPAKKEERYKDYVNPAGIILEHKMDKDTMAQYRLERGDSRLFEANYVGKKQKEFNQAFDAQIESLEISIENLGQEARDALAMPDLRPFKDFWEDAIKRAVYMDTAKRTAKKQYSDLTGGEDLFADINLDELFSGRMGPDYEKLIDRITSLEESPPEFGHNMDALTDFRDDLVDRRNIIMDHVFDTGSFTRANVLEQDFRDTYEGYYKNLKERVNYFRQQHIDESDFEKDEALKRVEANFQLLNSKLEELNKDSKEFDPNKPELVKQRKLRLAPLRQEIEVLTKDLQNMINGLGMPAPRPNKEDAENEGDMFTRDPSAGGDFNVAPVFGKVEAGKMQKMGMGGGYGGINREDAIRAREKFKEEREAKDKKDNALRESREKNTTAIQELTKALKGLSLEKGIPEQLRDVGQDVRSKIKADKGLDISDVEAEGFAKYARIIKKAIKGELDGMTQDDVVEALQVIQGILSGAPSEISEENQENLMKAFRSMKGFIKESYEKEKETKTSKSSDVQKEKSKNTEKTAVSYARRAGQEDASKLSTKENLSVKYEGVIDSMEKLQDLLGSTISVTTKTDEKETSKSFDKDSVSNKKESELNKFAETVKMEMNYSAKSAIDTLRSQASSEEEKNIARKTLESFGVSVSKRSEGILSDSRAQGGDKFEHSYAKEAHEVQERLRSTVNYNAHGIEKNIIEKGYISRELAQSLRNMSYNMDSLEEYKVSQGDVKTRYIKDKIETDPDYKYSDQHFQDGMIGVDSIKLNEFMATDSYREKYEKTGHDTKITDGLEKLKESGFSNEVTTKDYKNNNEVSELLSIINDYNSANTEKVESAYSRLDEILRVNSQNKEVSQTGSSELINYVKQSLETIKSSSATKEERSNAFKDVERISKITLSEKDKETLSSASNNTNKESSSLLESNILKSVSDRVDMQKDSTSSSKSENVSRSIQSFENAISSHSEKNRYSVSDNTFSKESMFKTDYKRDVGISKSDSREKVSEKQTKPVYEAVKSLFDVSWLNSAPPQKEVQESTNVSKEQKFNVVNRLQKFQEDKFGEERKIDLQKVDSSKMEKDYIRTFLNTIQNRTDLQVDRSIFKKLDGTMNIPQASSSQIDKNSTSMNLDNAVMRFEKAVEKMENKVSIDHIEPINLIS
jgi:TP901 family phage tail tape measure protein